MNTEAIVRLAPGEHALFGYGSLLSIASLERTLGRGYSGQWHMGRLHGWRRGWDVFMPRHPWLYRDAEGRVTRPERVIYLNLREQAGASCNGALFVVTDEELKRFDEREWIYERRRINDALAGVRVEGGDAWTYSALDAFVVRDNWRPPQAIIRRSYLGIMERAHKELGEEFRREYYASTDAFDEALAVDDFRE